MTFISDNNNNIYQRLNQIRLDFKIETKVSISINPGQVSGIREGDRRLVHGVGCFPD